VTNMKTVRNKMFECQFFSRRISYELQMDFTWSSVTYELARAYLTGSVHGISKFLCLKKTGGE
jgi:hypothetical protein